LRVGTLEVRSKIDLLGKAVAKIGHLAGASFTYADMNLLPVLAYLSACKESSEMLANTEAFRNILTGTANARVLRQQLHPPLVTRTLL
jgi:hypothetical protein